MYATARAEFYLAVSLFLDFDLLRDVSPDFFDGYLSEHIDRDFFYEWLEATSWNREAAGSYVISRCAVQPLMCGHLLQRWQEHRQFQGPGRVFKITL
jgi:hypothetical protein